MSYNNKQIKQMIKDMDDLRPMRWVYGSDVHKSHIGWLEYIEDQDSGNPEPVFYGKPVSIKAED